MCDYPEQQSGGVVGFHQAVDGLKEPPQWILKLFLLFPLVQPVGGQEEMNINVTGKSEKSQVEEAQEGCQKP